MKEYYNLKNIKRDKLTTWLGVLLMLSGVLSVFFVTEVTWVDAIPLVVIGLGLLPLGGKAGDKESCDKINSVVLVFFMAGILFTFTKCTTYKQCSDKWGYGADTLLIHDTILIHDTVKVKLPPDSVDVSLLIDSILLMKPGDTFSKTSKDKRTTLTVKKSKDNQRLELLAKCNEINLLVPVQVVYPTVSKQIVNKFYDKPKKGFQKYWNDYCGVAGIVLPFLILLILILKLK